MGDAEEGNENAQLCHKRMIKTGMFFRSRNTTACCLSDFCNIWVVPECLAGQGRAVRMDVDEAMALSWGWQALFVMVDILAAAMRILFIILAWYLICIVSYCRVSTMVCLLPRSRHDRLEKPPVSRPGLSGPENCAIR